MGYDYQGFASLSVNLNRQKYGALDISQVFTKQADLDYYTSKGAVTEGVSDYWLAVTPYPYAGQYLALVNNETREVTAYILVEKEDGTFATNEVGKTPIGDDKSIEVVDGKISIVGFDGATAGQQPRIGTDGTIEWYTPDTSTVSGLADTVAGHTTDIANLQNDKADKDDVYTKDEIDSKVSSVYRYKGSVATYDALPTENLTVGDVYNVEAADSQNGVKAGDNVAWNGTTWDVLAGTIDLSAYVEKEENARLMTNAEGTKLAGIEEGANVNVIDSVDETQFNVDEDKKLTLLDIAIGKVTGLQDALDGKVDAVEGSRLITDAEGMKLAGIEEGAEANVIEIVKLNGEALTVTDKAIDIPVAGDSLGVVKSSTEENKVSVAESGEMTVNSVNVNKLVQTENETLILDGGTAAN